MFFLYVTVQSTEITKNGLNGNEVSVLNIFISLPLTPCSYLPEMTPFNKSRLKRGQLITFLWTTLVLRKTIKILSRQTVRKVWNGEEKTAKAHIAQKSKIK